MANASGRSREAPARPRVGVESRTWQVFSFRDGKVVSCRGYLTKAEALASVGLGG